MAREFQRGHKARISDLTAGTDLYVGVQITGPGLTFDISCFGLDADERLSDDQYFVFFDGNCRLCTDTVRTLRAMDTTADVRFVDVQQREIESDPLGTLTRIYDFLGLELRPDMREAVTRWGEANHAGAHGQHRYTAEQYGLSVEQIRSDYDVYIRHFDIPVGR